MTEIIEDIIIRKEKYKDVAFKRKVGIRLVTKLYNDWKKNDDMLIMLKDKE